MPPSGLCSLFQSAMVYLLSFSGFADCLSLLESICENRHSGCLLPTGQLHFSSGQIQDLWNWHLIISEIAYFFCHKSGYITLIFSKYNKVYKIYFHNKKENTKKNISKFFFLERKARWLWYSAMEIIYHSCIPVFVLAENLPGKLAHKGICCSQAIHRGISQSLGLVCRWPFSRGSPLLLQLRHYQKARD